MTLADAFLPAILESAEDDLPRLAYADWLTDRDDPRGEFIHVQCLLARMAESNPMRKSLETRESELLADHQEGWLEPLVPLLRRWTFRRGFLDAITVAAAAYLEHPTLPMPATVRRVEVDLDGFEVPSDVLDLVPQSVAHSNVLLPVGFRGGVLVLAMQDPLDPDLMAKLRYILNRDLEAVPAPGAQVAEAIHRHHGFPVFAGQQPDLLGCLSSHPACPTTEVNLGSWDNGSPAARLLARIVAQAIGLNAREVHIGRSPDQGRVRYAHHGGIAFGAFSPVQLLWPLVTRLRLVAGIWVDDPREVQAGGIRLTVRDRQIDVGVLVRLTDEGPTAVLTFAPADPGNARDGR